MADLPRRIPRGWGVILVLAGCARQPDAGTEPTVHELPVAGAVLPYVEQGTGTPVVFVHGAWMDLRYWEPQRQQVAVHHRFIAYTQRYHGTRPWPDAGDHYDAVTHAADLTALLRGLGTGPAHLVGLSWGGVVAAKVAAEHPDLVRSLTLVEPALGGLLQGDPGAKAVLEERTAAVGPIVSSARSGDVERAAVLFFDWVDNRGSGAFARQPEALQRMVLDNARTIPLYFAVPSPEVSCETLGRVTAPTLVIHGEESLEFFQRISAAVAGCIPDSRSVAIPGASHLMSDQHPSRFTSVVLDFVQGVDGSRRSER